MKMDDDALLDLLKRKEESAGDYVWGELADAREESLREYHRMPYGNEQEDWSQIVSSDVQDTVEWILPALLKIFTSTDKAVSFEPNTAADVAGADQATDTCNYVFYKQNNGFLVLYTAFKDALTVKNCAVMWRRETQETVTSYPFKGATDEMLALMLQEPEAEIQEVGTEVVLDELGQSVQIHSGRIKRTETRNVVKVEAFSPNDLLVERDWTSPLLQDCPYVCRMMPVTLTDLQMMGFKDVTADDLRASQTTQDDRLEDIGRRDRFGNEPRGDDDDESMAQGWLRLEFVLADRDGDGVAERLCVYRLDGRILKVETVSHVPIATASPLLNPHRWDGMSMAEVVADLQKQHTELLRQTFNNLYLTNNPRTKVLTDSNWSPMANIDDLLDARPGGVIRQRSADAVTEQVTPFAAGASMPMLEYIQGMRENRTGVSRTSMGLNPDSLNNTATGRQIDQSAAQQRIELIARIFAEILLKPIFQGILKTLTDGGMEKLAFRLRDEFVEYDPSEWRDQYDMTIHVGLGTGDKIAQTQSLSSILQLQIQGMQMGLATPKHIYNTASKLAETAGFKDVQTFFQDPSTLPPQPQQPPLPLQIEQMKMQADVQKTQAQFQIDLQKTQMQTDAKLQETRAQLELQAANDMRDAERERMKAEMDAQLEQQRIEFERWKAELQAQTQIYLEQIKQQVAAPTDLTGNPDMTNALAASIDGFRAAIESLNRPKQIVRGPDGRAQGIM